LPNNAVWVKIFSRIPFFELTFTIIPISIIWQLPTIITSLSPFPLTMQIGVFVGLFFIIFLCIMGIFMRKDLYQKLSFIDDKLSHIETQEQEDELAKTEMQKAIRGQTDD
jgi:hypothetical protein